MKRRLLILVLLLFGICFVASAQEWEASDSIRNNVYYNESLRLTNLARLAFANGDYDASIRYSEEAMHYADLSDNYVNMRLKLWECNNAINAANNRLIYAASVNAAARFPAEYAEAQAAYADARALRVERKWDDSIYAANRVLEILAYIGGDPSGGLAGSGGIGGIGPLPAQYTVRSWENYRDCLWNIAGRPWVYDDPHRWRLLYDANKSKMPEPDNPNLINPGMVLDIPSIRGEVRQGMWDAQGVYQKLP